jgi:MFS family permease
MMRPRIKKSYIFRKIRDYAIPSDDIIKTTSNLSITDGLLWAIYTTMTATFVIPLSIFLLGQNAPVGYITGIPVLVVPLAQYFSRYFSRKVKDLKRLTVYTTLIDRLLWLPIVFLVFIHGRMLTYLLLIILLSARTFFASFSGTTWTLWVPGVIPAGRRSSYFAFRNFVMKIFSLVGYALALGIFLRISNEELAFIVVFLSGTLVFSSFSLLVMTKISPYSIPEFERTTVKKKVTTTFRYFIIFSLVWNLGYSMVLPYFQLYLVSPQYLGQSESFYTIVYIVIAISFIASQILWGKLANIFGNYKIIIINSIIIMVSAILIPIIHNPNLILIPSVLYGLGQSGIALSMFNEMLGRTQSARINSISMYNLVQSISVGLGPILANFLIEIFGVDIHLVFELSVGFMLSSILYFALSDQRLKKSIDEIPSS